MIFHIRKASAEDAPFLAETIMKAIGAELCENLGGGREYIPKVRRLFSELAAVTNTQYSFTNGLIAVDESGKYLGAVIAYEGSRLHELRTAFINKANELLGWNVTDEDAENWEDETNEREVYIDSLYVVEEFRKHGIATALINKVIDNFAPLKKPYGILVEPENSGARRLYEKLGFREDGINRFCNVPMTHLTLKTTVQKESE